MYSWTAHTKNKHYTKQHKPKIYHRTTRILAAGRFCWAWNFTCLKLRKVMDKTNQVYKFITFYCCANLRTGRANELLSLGVEFGSLLTFEFRKIMKRGSSCVLIGLGTAKVVCLFATTNDSLGSFYVCRGLMETCEVVWLGIKICSQNINKQ